MTRRLVHLLLALTPFPVSSALGQAAVTEPDLAHVADGWLTDAVAQTDYGLDELALPIALAALPQDEAPSIEPTGPGAAVQDSGWRFEVAPFLWALTLDADFTVKGLDATIDMSFSDIWDDLEFGGMLELRALKDRWIFQFDGLYAKLDIDGAADVRGDLTGEIVIVGEIEKQLFFRDIVIPFEFDIQYDIPDDVDVDLSVEYELVLLELFAGYELFLVPLAEGPDPMTGRTPQLSIAPYGGVRFTEMSFDVDLLVEASVGPDSVSDRFHINDREDWFDAVIGVEVGVLHLGKWSFGARADVGGFGIADSSDFVWGFSGRVNYHATPTFVIFGGYSLLDYDYSTGSGANEFAFDGRFHGLTLGAGLTF